jgi:hypothetical protein
MNALRSKGFLSDLYRDLRDRRLLIPLLGLLACLIAVPMLLGGGDNEPLPPPPPADLADSSEVESAVLVDQAGIRNYRERLSSLKERNPFKQQYPVKTPSAAEIKHATDGVPTDSTGPALTQSQVETINQASTPPASDANTSAPVDSSPAPPTSNGSSPNAPSTTSSPAQVRFYTGRIDVQVGPLGDTKTLTDVRHLEFLPDDRTPIVSFIGLADGGDHALFSVNPDVTDTRGDGSCAPKAVDGCQYLNLKVGDQRYFKYGPQDKTYRLKLLDTRVVRIPDPRHEQGGTDQPTTAGG